MKDQILTQSTNSFLQEYHSNAIFVDNLRKQSNKIQQMIAYIDRLKNEGRLKDKLINQLKKKQSEIKMQRIKIEECIIEEYLGKLKISQLKIQQLQNTINQLQIENQLLNIAKKQNGSQFRGLKNVQYQQIDRMNLDIQQLKGQNRKLSQRYQNCKQQCVILRQQLEEQRKNNKQLQFILKKNTNNKQNLIQENQLKYKKLENDYMKLKKQNAVLEANNVKLEQYLRQVQNELTLQIIQYQNQIKDMIDQVNKFENNSMNWKQKYYQLQIMVNHIESLRNNHRLNKIYNKKQEQILNQDYTKLVDKKYSNIPAQNDIITEQSQSQTDQSIQLRKLKKWKK